MHVPVRHAQSATWRVAAAAACLLVIPGCDKSTPPLVPTTMVAAVSSFLLDAIGATQAVSVAVTDQNGGAMPDVTVTWTSSAPSVVSVGGGSSPTVTAVGNGVATLTAKAGSAQAIIQVTVAQTPVAPLKLAGDSQAATVGEALGILIRIRTVDRLGNAMPTQSVVFAPGAGGGSAAPGLVTTSADGTGLTVWTLGPTPGLQTLLANASGSSEVATFTATAAVGPPATVAASAGNNQTAIAGEPVAIAPAVVVSDAFGNPIPGVAVVFAASAGNGTVTGASTTTNASGIATVGGWALGPVAGNMTMTATVAGLAPATIKASATPGPAAIVVASSGQAQTALVSTTVSIPPSVRVTDINGNAVASVPVTFAVTSGGGSITGGSAVTNAGGIANVGSWTLGPAVGPNTLSAAVVGTGISGSPVSFTATGSAVAVEAYNIDLRYLTSATPTQIAAFSAAVARWQGVITGELGNITLNVPSGTCGANAPALNESIDDLLIFVTLDAIDGVGGVLASAGPCYVRTSNGLTIVGRMTFDTADLTQMENQGRLGDVILHEMAHVIGVGGLWRVAPYFSLLTNPSLPSSPGVDTHFNGSNGIAGFNAIGGGTYTGGAKVPVENTQGGTGTRDVHWRESVLANELMTGFVNAVNPLSLLTIRSLQDLGYTVNTALADPFFLILTAAARHETGPRIDLGNDATRDPIFVVDDMGRTVRMVRPPD